MIGLAVVFGGLSIFAADRWVKSQVVETPVANAPQDAAVPAVEMARIVVARNALKYGTHITADEVQEVDWPANAVPEGAFRSVNDLVSDGKRIVLSAFAPNEPILPTKISGKDGRASLSNLLTPGMRAVTVRVDDITGVAGFVTSGDRVDVLLTRSKNVAVPAAANEVQGQATTTSEMASEVILQNVKVLTLDQNADDTNTAAIVARAVTVEVTSADAQKVALAQQLGTLYLILRPAGDDQGSQTGELTSADLDGTNRKNAEETASVEPVENPVAPSPSLLTLQPEGPHYRSLVVTRGHTAETYSVINESGAPAPVQAGVNP